MYLEKYRISKKPYSTFSLNSKPDYSFSDYSTYYGVTTKDDIKLKYVIEQMELVNLEPYNLVIHIPYEENMLDTNKRLNFFVNENLINVFDYYYIIVNDFMYIFLKNNFTEVHSLKIFDTRLNIKLKEVNEEKVDFIPGFNENFYMYEEEISSNIYKYKVTYENNKYIYLDSSLPTLNDLIKNEDIINKFSFFDSLNITGIRLYDKINNKLLTSSELPSDDIFISEPLNLGLINNSNIDNYGLIIFYEGLSLEEYKNSSKSDFNMEENKFDLNFSFDYLINKFGGDNDIFLSKRDKIIETNVSNLFKDGSDIQLLEHLLSFDIDEFDRLNLERYAITKPTSIPSFVNSTNDAKIKAYKDLTKSDLENTFMKFIFINNGRLPFEIFYKYRKFTDTVFTEYKDRYTIIYIKTSVFSKYYNITDTSILNELHLGIRFLPDNSKEIFINNINEYYNGVMIPSKDFYYSNKKLIYDNGYPITMDDIEFNTLPPYNILALFPTKKLPNKNIHKLNVVILPDAIYEEDIIFNKRVKVSGFSQQEIDDFKSNNIDNIIYANRLRLKEPIMNISCEIYIDDKLLINGIDYIIESSKCIRFYNIPHSSEYIKLKINSTFNANKLLKERNKSLLNEIISSEEYFESIKDEVNNLIECDILGNYDRDIIRNTMFLTKYFSTEMILDLDDLSQYGEEWLNELKEEFPDYVTTDSNGETIISLYKEFSDDLEVLVDYPRDISLPERLPLNTLISRHLLAINYLNDYGYTHNEYSSIDLKRFNINKKLLKQYMVDINFSPEFIEYVPNIPLNPVFL